MTTIGNFTQDENGFTGTITTLALKAKAAIKSIPKRSEHAPDYRVYANGAEIGAGWGKVSETSKPYLSIKLDDPSFGRPIYCRLITREDNTRVLLWSR